MTKGDFQKRIMVLIHERIPVSHNYEVDNLKKNRNKYAERFKT